MNKWERKLWFQKNKGKLIKRGTIALSVLLLVVGVIYITYSKFESTQEFTIINGKIVDNGDVKISYEYDGTKQSTPPQKSDGYILTEANCENGDGLWDDLNWKLTVSNITGKTKCNLVFSKTSNYKIVTFNANGGFVDVNYKKISSNEQIGVLPEPSMNYNVFLGWFTDPIDGTQIESSTVLTNDITAYAHWKDLRYFLYNYGQEYPDITGSWDIIKGSNNLQFTKKDKYFEFSGQFYGSGAQTILITNKKVVGNFSKIGFTYEVVSRNINANDTGAISVSGVSNYTSNYGNNGYTTYGSVGFTLRGTLLNTEIPLVSNSAYFPNDGFYVRYYLWSEFASSINFRIYSIWLI